MMGQLRNEIGKRAVASSCNAAADEDLVAAATALTILAFLCVTGPDGAIRTKTIYN